MQNFTYQPAVKRPLARDVVFHCLAEDIAQLRIRPGGGISAANLEDEFDVSRTPIREALIRLSHLGLVELSPSAPTRVAPICARSQRQRAEAAAALVIAAARDAGSHLSREQLHHLREHAAAVPLSAGTQSEATQWWTFAQAIVTAGGNLVMRELFDMNLGLHLRRSLRDLRVQPALSVELLRHLHEVMLALEVGDGPTAAWRVAAAIDAATAAFDAGLCFSRQGCPQCLPEAA